MNESDLVWYVCYGSNLCFERFMCYLTGEGSSRYGIARDPSRRCLNPNPPQRSEVTIIPHPMYFARESSSWQGQGVAFIDYKKKGISIGRAYLVTKEQYLHVKKKEGSWYEKEIVLPNIEGIPSFTFTEPRRHPFVFPSEAYRKVILDGLLECGLNSDAARLYLDTCIEMGNGND